MRTEEKIIFNEICKGNVQVYESLFAEYYDSLVKFAQSYLFDSQESQDLVQDLFVHIWENAGQIRINTSIKAYFYQAIRNKCLNHLRHLKVKDKNNTLYIDGILQSGDEIEHFNLELVASIRQTVDELPDQMKKVFKMKLIDNMSRDDIAEKLGISVNTVKTQLSRAKSKLRDELKQKLQINFFL